MKTYRLFTLMMTGALMAGAACLTACDDDEEVTTGYPVVITAQAFSYESSGSEATPDEGTTWSEGQEIGVYMLQPDNNAVEYPYANLCYYANSITDQDYFLPKDIDLIPQLPADGSQRSLVVYYPYQAQLADHRLAVNVADQQNTQIDDLLYARFDGLTKDQRKAVLKMRPALSLLSFRVQTGGGMTADRMRGLTITLKHVPVSGFFNVLDGSVTNRNVFFDVPLVVVDESTPATRAEADKPLFRIEGVMLPTASTEGYVAELYFPNDGGRIETYEIKRGTSSLEGSTEYVFTTTITDEDMLVECSSAPISNWVPGGSIGGDGTEVK